MRLDSVNSTNDEARIKLSAALTPFAFLCCGSINDPYFIVSRARSHENKDDFVRIFKSDIKINNANPVWNPIKLKMA